MSPRLLAAALALVCATAPAAQTDAGHTFEVRNGQVWLDGRYLPDAIPDGLDLTGLTAGPLEYSGPLSPVLEVDGELYVFEGGRLVPLAATSRPERGVYILGETTVDPRAAADMPRERMAPMVEAAYVQEVAAQNQALYAKLRQEAEMEAEIEVLAGRVRALPAGPDRTVLRGALQALLSDLLTLKHEIREEEIAVAADRLEAARRGLQARRAAHDLIVEGRLRELVGDR